MALPSRSSPNSSTSAINSPVSSNSPTGDWPTRPDRIRPIGRQTILGGLETMANCPDRAMGGRSATDTWQRVRTGVESHVRASARTQINLVLLVALPILMVEGYWAAVNRLGVKWFERLRISSSRKSKISGRPRGLSVESRSIRATRKAYNRRLRSTSLT